MENAGGQVNWEGRRPSSARGAHTVGALRMKRKVSLLSLCHDDRVNTGTHTRGKFFMLALAITA